MIRDGGGGGGGGGGEWGRGGGAHSEHRFPAGGWMSCLEFGLDSAADSARKRPERPWTAAKTMEVPSPLQRLVHCAIQ